MILVGDAIQVDDDDGAPSVEDGKRSPTPNSVANTRSDGRKNGKDKLKKGGDNHFKESLDNIMAIMKDMARKGRT